MNKNTRQQSEVDFLKKNSGKLTLAEFSAKLKRTPCTVRRWAKELNIEFIIAGAKCIKISSLPKKPSFSSVEKTAFSTKW